MEMLFEVLHLLCELWTLGATCWFGGGVYEHLMERFLVHVELKWIL